MTAPSITVRIIAARQILLKGGKLEKVELNPTDLEAFDAATHPLKNGRRFAGAPVVVAAESAVVGRYNSRIPV